MRINKSEIRNIALEIFDRRLYGTGFFRNFLYCLIPFAVVFYIIYLINPNQSIFFLIAYIAFILITGLFSKNYHRFYFHPMDLLFSWFFIFSSIISLAYCFVAKFPRSLIGFLQLLLIMIIAVLSFCFSSMHIIVLSQRRSLREKIGFKDNFFENQKEKWNMKLKVFPNRNKIIGCFDKGHYILILFDRGYFNLTVLWCCSLIEEIVDKIADGILQNNPEKALLFKRENGRRLPYVKQLENLGYKPSFEGKCLRNLWEVWNVRNKIAHRNYQPSFDETVDTIEFFISFIKEMPIVLEKLG